MYIYLCLLFLDYKLHMDFHSLEVVDRVSETQLQVNENSKLGLRWRMYEYTNCLHLYILCNINPLTAGVAYIRVFIFYSHNKYHILDMLKIKCDTNQH